LVKRLRKRKGKKKRKSYSDGVNQFRSEGESLLAAQLSKLGTTWEYEPKDARMRWQPKIRTYLPDFRVTRDDGSVLIIEYKGRLTIDGRQKILAIKTQYPDVDFRLIFERPNNPINKGSNTTYGEWATKHNIIWAYSRMPKSWLKPQKRRANHSAYRDKQS